MRKEGDSELERRLAALRTTGNPTTATESSTQDADFLSRLHGLTGTRPLALQPTASATTGSSIQHAPGVYDDDLDDLLMAPGLLDDLDLGLSGISDPRGVPLTIFEGHIPLEEPVVTDEADAILAEARSELAFEAQYGAELSKARLPSKSVAELGPPPVLPTMEDFGRSLEDSIGRWCCALCPCLLIFLTSLTLSWMLYLQAFAMKTRLCSAQAARAICTAKGVTKKVTETWAWTGLTKHRRYRLSSDQIIVEYTPSWH